MTPITKFSELDTKLGEIVQVVGVYKEINGAQRPGKYYPSGRACLRLDYSGCGESPG